MGDIVCAFLTLVEGLIESPKGAVITFVLFIVFGLLVWGVFKLCEGNEAIAQYGPFVAVGIGIGFLIFAVYEATRP